MSNWKLLNKCRVHPPHPLGTTSADKFNGFFCIELNRRKIKIIASDGEGWQHVSVSIHGSEQVPSWSIMCQVKDLFWEDEDVVVQYHPAKSQYRNYHPGCLHLWRPLNEKLPTPNPEMIAPEA